MLKQCALSGEPLIKEVQRFVSADDPAVPIPLLSFERLTVRKEDFENKYLDYWNSTSDKTGTARPVDGVILPVAPTAAVINDKYMYYGYTNVANLLDYTCVSFPVTTADRDLDVADHDYVPLNDLDRDNWNAYDPQAYHGAPVGLQVMGKRLEEEKMLSVAEAIVSALDASRQT
jgi:amidase